jgi:hypothetical protein
MAPAAILLEQLAAARRRGDSFEQAWPDALGAALQAADLLERAEWADILGGMSATWRRAFDRQEFGRRARALQAVAEDSDRVPLSEAELAELLDRECLHCGAPLPEGRRGVPARYCGAKCRQKAKRERGQLAGAAA